MKSSNMKLTELQFNIKLAAVVSMLPTSSFTFHFIYPALLTRQIELILFATK